MHISPRYSVTDWRTLNLTTPSDWRTAVRILEDCINPRFFRVVKAIDRQDFSGFTVLALDCLLIETLQQFKDGVRETPRGESGAYFERLLTSAPFSAHFTQATAATFYDHFRCCILHEAE